MSVRDLRRRTLPLTVCLAVGLLIVAVLALGALRPTTGPAPAGEAAAPAAAPMADGPVSFNIATFNILSSWHTRPGRGEAWMAPGPMRAHLAAEAIRLYDLGVVGLQEVDMDQIGVLAAELPNYAFWAGSSEGHAGVNTNLAWDTRRFTKTADGLLWVEFLSQRRANPYVRLRDNATGRQFWVMDVHNTPKRGGDPRLTEERKRQVAAEVTRIRTLQGTGLPVFLVGDLNDKDYTYCQFVTKTQLRSVLGYPGGCELPRGSHIEWIFGTKTTWSNYKYDRAAMLTRITDHPIMAATATLQ